MERVSITEIEKLMKKGEFNHLQEVSIHLEIGKNLRGMLEVGGANEKFWAAFDLFREFVKDPKSMGFEIDKWESEGGTSWHIEVRKLK